MPPATLSLTEADQLRALRGFLLSVLPDGTAAILGQVNRVPEPLVEDFVVFWPIRRERLATNVTDYDDSSFVGSIAGTTLTVDSIERGSIREGAVIRGTADGEIAASTVVGVQISGSIGGTGAYAVAPSQIAGSQLIYAGSRLDTSPTDWVVQMDVHGPRSGDNAQVIETLLRSEVATDAFEAYGYAVVPLYGESRGQLPFVNESQQYEDRWVIDAHVQIGPIVGTQQQFADELVVESIEADAPAP